jgi:hypothetical protein
MTQPAASHIARDSIKVFCVPRKKSTSCKRSLLLAYINGERLVSSKCEMVELSEGAAET